MFKMKIDEEKSLDVDEVKRMFKERFKLEEEWNEKIILKPTLETLKELTQEEVNFLRKFPEASFIALDLRATWFPDIPTNKVLTFTFPIGRQEFINYCNEYCSDYLINEEDGYALVVRKKIRKLKVYLAGALFNEAEISQRLKEGKILRETFKHKIDLFNPIEQPFNEDKEILPTPRDIFDGDTNAILNCDVFLADITNNDPGVMVELGIAYATKKQVIAVNSDIRLKSANKYDIPSYSMNHYVLGCLDNRKSILVYSFEEAIEELKRLL